MKICKNCNNQFPSTIKINGKTKVLSSRKYCLECSPWGMHNTRPFGYIRRAEDKKNKICVVCEKPFAKKGARCPSCSVNMRRYDRRKQAIESKGGKCQKCGYNKCWAALAFHHRDELHKSFNISLSYTRSLESFLKEIDKCDLLCFNCHIELHWDEHGESRQKLLDNYQRYKEIKATKKK